MFKNRFWTPGKLLSSEAFVRKVKVGIWVPRTYVKSQAPTASACNSSLKEAEMGVPGETGWTDQLELANSGFDGRPCLKKQTKWKLIDEDT